MKKFIDAQIEVVLLEENKTEILTISDGGDEMEPEPFGLPLSK